ncbi:NifU family protein [Nonomuraea spiralis]|uniref:NifU family protein n=1 Tax=Nonomuraea spiralis TaxID=46182 RepID=A0ABV5IJ17_9ACTN|nr:NifU family protein [Nonomuraea spiralis]GGS98105.1 thioredoxin [Nonomuraea spiralis]
MAERDAVDEKTAERGRLDDQAVARLLERLEETLGRLEGMPGPSAEAALDAVAILAEVYGEALSRVMDRAPAGTAVAAALADDELLGHLLVLHDIHPEPLRRRVERALDGLASVLRTHGVEARLAEVTADVARVRLTGGCSSGSEPVRQAVEQAVRAVAPELGTVEVSRAAPAAFVPAEALLTRPGGPV